MAKLETVDRGLYLYQPQALHLTLLGCTQRSGDFKSFSPKRLNGIVEVCRQVLKQSLRTRLRLEGIGISGAQVFVQGYFEDGGWPRLRADLGAALEGIGETPLAYPYKWPAHVNIARATTKNAKDLERILRIMTPNRAMTFGLLEVEHVELLLTDFVISARASMPLADFGGP